MSRGKQHALVDTGWRKSSYSSDNSYCVEVAFGGEAVGVRDTKDRAGGTLAFSRARWGDFLASLRR